MTYQLQNHPDRPHPTQKRGMRYRLIKNPTRVRKWSWRCRGLDGGGAVPLPGHTGTLNAMLDQYKRYTGLLEFHQENSQFFYGQSQIIELWVLAQIRPYGDMHEHRAAHNPSQATLWTAGLIDSAPTQAAYDFAWASCTYHTLLEIRYAQTAHLFTKSTARTNRAEATKQNR